MSNVWEAMKKHQAEVAAKAAAEGKSGAKRPPQRRDDPALVDIELVSEPGIKTPPRADDPAVRPASPAPAVVLGRGTGRAMPPVIVGRDDTFSELVVAHHDRGGGIAEEYRSLRTNLLARSASGKFGYIITSAEAGEGKTITSLNLAVVLAEQAERRTIVIDGDMRRARLAKMVEITPGPGLGEVLRGQTTLSQAVRTTPYPNLFFLPTNRCDQHEIGELLGRMEREELFADLRRQFDYILVDTPPINIASDAAILGQSVGEALLVVRMNKTRQESVEKAIRLLRAANVDLSGMVLTHRKYHIPNYLYRYA